MKGKPNKTEIAWDELFKRYDIVERVREKGSFLIAAGQIKEFREPRLMAKFDHRKNLPKAFRDQGFGILPISRGDYLIGPFRLFESHLKPDDTMRIAKASLPEAIESISLGSITSESVALNCAWDSRILHRFLGEETLYPTLSGRMGSNRFSFRICDETGARKSKISVDGAQIEIDAAYEGARCLVVIEAKMDLAEDFIIRQLYYPFRHFSSLPVKKPVRTVYLTYTGGVFHLAEYAFENPQEYNSVRLVKAERYALESSTLSRKDIEAMLKATIAESEPDDIPFPQADTFARVVNLCERLSSGPMTKEDIEECYGFNPRQVDYYYNAAKYLGLAKKEGGRGSRVVLTSSGRQWTTLSVAQRRYDLARRILRHEPFRRILRLALTHGTVPDAAVIQKVLLETNPRIGDISKNTYSRRASTVRHWVQWILSLAEEK